MKVGVVSQYYSPEPVPIPPALAQGLAERGHEVIVMTSFPSYPQGRVYEGYQQRIAFQEMNGSIRVHRLPIFVSHSRRAIGRVANYLSFALSSLAAGRTMRNVDVVYVYATQMTAAIAPAFWARHRKIPFVLHVQDLWPESITGSSMAGGSRSKRLITRLLVPWLLRTYEEAAAVIGIGPTMTQRLGERGANATKLHTVFNWAENDAHHASSQADDHRPSNGDLVTVMYAGNLGEFQDLGTVLEAVALVRDLPNFRLELVGSGVAEMALKERAHELQLSNVTFHDRVPSGEMEPHYARSDFQLIPLKDLEIFRATVPSKLQTSLARGIPVITNVAGDVADIVNVEGLGFASRPGDPEALADSFRRAHALPRAQRLVMGTRARDFYTSSMSQSAGIDKIEEILQAAARSPGKKEQRVKQL
jgi:colanic acid biosynthesis glycosyl transferase WcaI